VREVEPVSPPQIDGAASKELDAFRRSPYWQLELERGGTYLFRFEARRYQDPTA
jgi:hypothetical protein